jgi:MFS superfamily sulfate permease-like transporter
MFKEIRNDLPASIVVFFVALPLCLGVALASGAPLFSGIIAGIIGGIVVGLASGSTLGVSGPAAGLAVIVLTAITTTFHGSFETFLLAVVRVYCKLYLVLQELVLLVISFPLL